jgi:hypothetical protein
MTHVWIMKKVHQGLTIVGVNRNIKCELPLLIHPSFESLIVISALGLQASLMDIHHDTSLTSILEDDSISLTSRAHIRSCSNKGARLWLIARPSICFFFIAHSTFTSTLHFCLGLIQPLESSLFMCECGHGLDASGTYLAHCPFKG